MLRKRSTHCAISITLSVLMAAPVAFSDEAEARYRRHHRDF